MMKLVNSELWEKVVKFHGHACPGLAVGVRMAAVTAEYFNLTGRVEDEELVCVSETDSCVLDAIQFMLGCTLGKGNLLLQLRGKNAMTFYCRQSQQACRIVRQVFLPSDALSNPDLSRSDKIQLILAEQGQQGFNLTPVPFATVPASAIISRSFNCAGCGELTAEHMLRLFSGSKYCLDCLPEYSRILL